MTSILSQFTYVFPRINEEYIPKSAFKIRYENFEFIVVLYGLTNVLDVFMILMNGVIPKHLYKFVKVFLDDILIYSKLYGRRAQKAF